MLHASHDNLPVSNPLKEGLPVSFFAWLYLFPRKLTSLRRTQVLVLIHAAAGNVCSWRRQLSDPRLAANFNIVALDCRFNGFTTGKHRILFAAPND